MRREEFGELFRQGLEIAAGNAEELLGRPVPRNFDVLLYGPGHPKGDRLSPADALDELYLGEDRFYRIIDLAVVEVSRGSTTVFTRVSGHRPGSFDETWNNPPGTGPFKQLGAERIKVVDEPSRQSA